MPKPFPFIKQEDDTSYTQNYHQPLNISSDKWNISNDIPNSGHRIENILYRKTFLYKIFSIFLQ